MSASNSMVIYILTVRVLEWLHLLNQNLSTSSQADSWGGDRVYEKEQENESKQRNNRSRPHVLPMYKDCPFAPAPVKRWLSSRLRQIIAWGRGITATQIILLLASVAVVVAGLAAVWNIAFVPLAMADVGIRNREDALMVIPCKYLHLPLLTGTDRTQGVENKLSPFLLRSCFPFSLFLFLGEKKTTI